MRKSIKKMVGYRVAAAVASVLLYSIVVTVNIFSIKAAERESREASTLLETVQSAEVGHYKWASGLSNALYAGKEFTGSMDPTSCVLGQWLYGEVETDEKSILELRDKMEPLHKELHESASYVLDLMKTSPTQAQAYYQNTIQANLTTLVGYLEEIVEYGTTVNQTSSESMVRVIHTLQVVSGVCFFLALICLASLVQYVLKQIIKPILHIANSTRPLQDGKLELNIQYSAENELGELAEILKKSLHVIYSYVEDITKIMGQFARGNFDVRTSVDFIGDFRSIQDSVESFTGTMSGTMSQINRAEGQISGNAEQLSSSAQALAQGATQQASAVEELYATLDELSKTAKQNVETASNAQEGAHLAGEQVTLSSEQMEEMVAAMEDITQASQQIGEIIATIENIAFQTNILALNAAVEAARAGTAGKGFAVVASEVRSLAAQSDKAAKATKELIENSIQAADRGNQIVSEVSETLKKTLELVMQSNNSIGTIAEAVKGEAAAITQVTDGIGQISEVVQTNSASSEESAAVSTELFDQVRLLRDQTSRFKLKRK
ncbi:MAG: hypothetical protein HFH24_03895 [Ruminococcus sp.]|nr:hypothetical protein [Ruminococcus sp.]